MNDPVTGTPGRIIEMIEQRPGPPMMGDDYMKAVFAQLQSMMPFQVMMSPPKIVLFLRENEYMQLGLQFDVNDVYEVTFEGGQIKFRRATAEQQ